MCCGHSAENFFPGREKERESLPALRSRKFYGPSYVDIHGHNEAGRRSCAICFHTQESVENHSVFFQGQVSLGKTLKGFNFVHFGNGARKVCFQSKRLVIQQKNTEKKGTLRPSARVVSELLINIPE